MTSTTPESAGGDSPVTPRDDSHLDPSADGSDDAHADQPLDLRAGHNDRMDLSRPLGGEPESAGTPRAGSERSWVRTAVEWTLVIVVAVSVTMVIRATTVQTFWIPSKSMQPTLEVGDRVLVNRLSYKLHAVHRGDVVVFSRPESESASEVKDLIKRVVGLPGESVTIADNHVLIDGKVLEEPYLPPTVRIESVGTYPCPPTDPCVIPDGNVWVMGDNRTDSRDSRYFGPVAESKIVGRAFVIVWPLGRLGLL